MNTQNNISVHITKSNLTTELVPYHYPVSRKFTDFVGTHFLLGGNVPDVYICMNLFEQFEKYWVCS